MSDWFEASGAAGAVDVAALMDSGAPGVLWDLAQTGALVSVGTTSDGGALGVTITLDGRWRREYFRDSDELTSWLLGALEAVRAAIQAPTASPGPRRRRRPA